MIPAGLRVDDVHHAFGATRALAGVSLHVRPGSIHALIGENGAGKSTLVKILAGVLRPDGGTLFLDGRPFAPGSPGPARAAGVATVHQELSLAPHLTVAESIFLGREPRRWGLLDRARMHTEAGGTLTGLQRGDIPVTVPILDLSIADRQIVEIARALHGRSRVLILDEPTSSLTRTDSVRLFDLLRRLRDQHLAIIYISHFLEEVTELADTFTVLRDGRVAAGGRIADTDATALATHMVGHPLKTARRQRRVNPGAAVLLQVDDLQGAPLPRSASLTLRAGEILGVGGLVGAGRSELVRTLFGLQPVRSGSVRLLDVPAALTPAACLDAGLGLLSEDRAREGLALGLPLADNLVMSRWPRRRRGWLDLKARDRAARRWVEALNIRSGSIDAPVGRLSGGNQQKVALARLLHHDVDVLLLDEPTRGIDIASKETIYATIESLAARGKGILLTSSQLPELLSVCDRIAIMHRGRLGPFRAADQCSEHALMLEASVGDGAVGRDVQGPGSWGREVRGPSAQRGGPGPEAPASSAHKARPPTDTPGQGARKSSDREAARATATGQAGASKACRRACAHETGCPEAGSEKTDSEEAAPPQAATPETGPATGGPPAAAAETD